jgi:hypothetical protein
VYGGGGVKGAGLRYMVRGGAQAGAVMGEGAERVYRSILMKIGVEVRAGWAGRWAGQGPIYYMESSSI